MSIYEYIAETNPDAAEALCNKYGWTLQNMQSAQDLANCLHNLVAEEGEPAIVDLAGIHPDKDLIIEVYTGQNAVIADGAAAGGKTHGCGCASCKGKSDASAVEKMISATQGNAQGSSANPFLHQSNLMIIGGIVLIGLALVLKTKQ